MVASKLRLGDEVRVVAPSRNLTEVRQDVHHHAVDFWRKEGLILPFPRTAERLESSILPVSHHGLRTSMKHFPTQM